MGWVGGWVGGRGGNSFTSGICSPIDNEVLNIILKTCNASQMIIFVYGTMLSHARYRGLPQMCDSQLRLP